MSREFVETLNDCIERITNGESIQDCLDSYPEYADELRPLLEVSASTIRAADRLQPTPSSKQRNFLRFAQAASQASQHRERRQSWWQRYRRLAPIARPAMVSIIAVIIMVTGVGATTAASSNSVPGEPLYWVKTTKESVEGRLPRSDESRANYEAKLAQIRGDELNKLIQRGEFSKANNTMSRMTVHLKRCANHAGINLTVDPVEMPFKHSPHKGGDNANRLGERLENDRKVFKLKAEQIRLQLTPEQRKQMERYLRQTDLEYRLFIDAALSDSPARRPFIIVMEPSHENRQ